MHEKENNEVESYEFETESQISKYTGLLSNSHRTPKYQTQYQKPSEGLRYKDSRQNSISKDESKEVITDDSVSVIGVG
jgi:hypothetical protein